MHRITIFSLLVTGILFLGHNAVNPQEDKKEKITKPLGLKVPPGFEVSLYADDDLATDIFSLTIDSHGRVVVAGKGYIKILHDTDGDGRADKATTFADFPKSGAHGMYFDGEDLICDGDKGVRRLFDTNGDGKCDKVSPIWAPTTQDTGHAANGIVRGPDGWYYLICGNDAGIGKAHTTSPASPVKTVNAGAVVRLSPDGKKHEVVAHGFRNPYDVDFNQFGHMFTVDADGERVYQMPYYAPNRLFDIAQGMHHGWILPGWQRGWSRPPSWPDNVERMVEIGRGSPTGVTVYRHRAFPEHYRNGVFSLCWTFGRVYFFPPQRSGSTYAAKKEVFMHTTGDVGFAPTDLAVGPQGDLFVSIGGRGTRGSVFRVHYKGESPPAIKGDALHQVLAADQPLSSWSRARWAPMARDLGKKPFLLAVEDKSLPLEERLRAVEVLTELFGGVPIETANRVCFIKANREVAARAIWSVSRTNNSNAACKLFAANTHSAHPVVARAAWEAIVALPSPLDANQFQPAWGRGLNNKDRRVRCTALLAAMGPGRDSFLKFVIDSSNKLSAQERLARLWVAGPQWKNQEETRQCFDTCLTVVAQEKNASVRLNAIRLLQIALGDVDTDESAKKEFYGYVARSADKIDATLRRHAATSIARSFPSGDDELDREMARLLGMFAVEVPGLLEKISAKWTKQSHPKDDIHYLLVLSRFPGKRATGVTERTASALANLHRKLAARGTKPTDQVPEILETLFARLVKLDFKLAAALVSDPAFGVAGHELFANEMPRKERQQAARKIVAAIAKLDEHEARQAWSADLVRLVAVLPDNESLPILRTQFDDPRLRDPIALLLAKNQNPKDRDRFIQAFHSMQPGVIRAAALALSELPGKKATPTEIGKGVRALRGLAVRKADSATHQALNQLLVRWTGENIAPNSNPEARAAAWVDWYTKSYPKEAATIPGLSGSNLASWKKRSAQIDWSAGNVARGELVFQRKGCFQCHSGDRRFGPDLKGAAQRFSRDDLFTAIIDPNKDISPAYRPTMIVTTSGKVYSGVVIYTSPALTLLQTTPDTTVRIPQEELSLLQPGSQSFMPAGLLDDADDSELADLYAYLKSLKKN